MARSAARVPRVEPGAGRDERAPGSPDDATPGRGLDLPTAYDRWAPLVRAVVARRVRDPADTDDATQLVFLAAWRSRDRFDPARGDVPVWLLGIARHVTSDLLATRAREARRREAVSRVRVVTVVPDPADDVAARLDLDVALRSLAPERRRVVRLVYAQGRTHAQVAAETGLPLGTVKSHARRGLAQLRAHP
ncbi:RNA polymerase sigma factor [Cellulosimicrobium protaetiae]|uniref:Sigma-70 family RNA polymerase sigma factor n=1 Tax=Cellulosimicrobium protaetiae TaxID=2587808 RepID=A0A6M5UCE8_9MICO|nr:sigma-70 family RNA polymerase sigma factor [Cellulosimicrobium protaetiae]QJW34833.1 sigma-70 family RNA polymerase sigma factor [Cellulosimicrobium protaetiae]